MDTQKYSKKVVIIGPAYPLRGGLASYDERLAREFSQFGFDSSIYTFSYQYPSFLFPGTTQYSTEPPPEQLQIRVIINSVNPLNWIEVGRKLKRLKPDLVVVRYWLPFMGPCLGTLLRITRKNHHTKIICIADNIIPHEKRPGDRIFTRYFLRPIDAFITMSEKVLADLAKMVPQKPARFIAHPLYDNFGPIVSMEESRQKLQIPLEDKIILFFGFIRKYKGLDMALEAIRFLHLQPGFEAVKLLIAGEYYEDEKHYASLLQDPQIQPYLYIHTHFIPDSMVKYYMCAADCVIQPYRSATQSGVTPLAYHFEKPMIVTRVGGLPDMVPDRKVGLVADPNPEDLAQKIKEYFQIGEEYFLSHLREEKKRYSWARMVEAITSSAQALNSSN
ncbi:MAG: glycosyltransferase family 4 protein [Bacteroidota bacterium]|nr:glycosyltransferase family 4 protein [Bacteroidota bacterium]